MKSKIIIFISLFFVIIISCKRKKLEQLCSEDGFARGVRFQNIDYEPKDGKLYLYQANSNFIKLVEVQENNIGYNNQDSILFMRTQDGTNFFLNYDYRFVIDDTIYFDFSDFTVRVETLGYTMGGPHVRCGLASYKCNDSVYHTTEYHYITLPFEAGRIIEKGQYDKK